MEKDHANKAQIDPAKEKEGLKSPFLCLSLRGRFNIAVAKVFLCHQLSAPVK